MKVSTFFRSILRPARGWRHFRTILLILAAIVSPALLHGTEIFTGTLAFESEGLDLETGLVTDTLAADDSGVTHIQIAYNAFRSPRAVLIPGEAGGIELAYLWNTPFNEVTADWIGGLSFSPYAIDASLGSYDTVVVRTDTGAVFKLGNAVESEDALTFDFAPL